MIGELRYEWVGNKFIIPVKSKYTVIQGCSGEGKSFAVFALNQIGGLPKVTTAVEANFVGLCKSNDYSVIMIDEEDFKKVKHKCAGLMNESDKQFIIIARDITGNIPIDYRDIYRMRKSGKYHLCDRVFPDFEEFVKAGSYLCEDKRSGYLYFSNHFSNVKSAGGSGNLASLVDNGDTVFADGAALGCMMPKLMEAMEKHIGVHFYFPTSFEYLVCKYIDRKAGDGVEWWKNYASSERYYTDLCKELCKGLYIDYKKEHLHRDILKMRLFPIESSSLEERVRSLGIDGAESIIPYLPEAASGFSDDELKELVKSLLD